MIDNKFNRAFYFYEPITGTDFFLFFMSMLKFII